MFQDVRYSYEPPLKIARNTDFSYHILYYNLNIMSIADRKIMIFRRFSIILQGIIWIILYKASPLRSYAFLWEAASFNQKLLLMNQK